MSALDLISSLRQLRERLGKLEPLTPSEAALAKEIIQSAAAELTRTAAQAPHNPVNERGGATRPLGPLMADGLEDADVDAFLAEVRVELVRARAKFPGDRIMTIALAEEFGELAKAILDEPAANVRKEAVQTAVMAARVVLDGDSSVAEWRSDRGLDPLGNGHLKPLAES
jgi:hypothetical protein